MKATQRDFARTAPQAASRCTMFFFCGPDEAGANAAAEQVVSELPDAGERVELSGSAIKADPALLGDEARSSSLFGDSRHIWVRANGDEALAAVEAFFATGGESCPVLIVATGATDKSRTAKFLAPRDDALVAMFYPPDLRSLTASVRELADSEGVQLSRELAERVAAGSGLNIRLAKREIEKLALYLDAAPDSPQMADSAALEAIGAHIDEDSMAPLVDAVLSGDRAALPKQFARARELALNPVAISLQMERRASQLANIHAKAHSGRLADVLDGEVRARRVFWKDKGAVQQQLMHWNPPKLERLLARLLALHQKLLANSNAAETLLLQELTEICRFAGVRTRVGA